MAVENAKARFKNAVGILVDEPDRIAHRLLFAHASQLSLLDRNEDLPPALSEEFDLVLFALSDSEMPFGYGERAAKKLQDMSETEASALARQIFSIFLRLHNLTSGA